jgi:hypothetical protein
VELALPPPLAIVLIFTFLFSLSFSFNLNRSFAEDTDNCGGSSVNVAKTTTRQINLVIDDSGSMFVDDNSGHDVSIDRWSQAKYALEVFAAMLTDDDTMNVYRMSDFANNKIAGPNLIMTGKEPDSSRVGKVEGMQLQGGGTPFSPVQKAYDDLKGANDNQKWLVVLSDGEFDNNQPDGGLDSKLHQFVKDGSTTKSPLKVAFMAMGKAAPSFSDDSKSGVNYKKAEDGLDITNKLTDFANLIFNRSVISSTGPVITPDLDLDEVVAFAQGGNVKVGDAKDTNGNSYKIDSKTDVKWIDNQEAHYGDHMVQAIPNKDLVGELAVYKNIKAGNISFDISGQNSLTFFYTPHVSFGVELTDEQGNKVDADKIVGGKYNVNYGFMNSDCKFTDSKLLGTPTYSASVTNNGQIIADSLKSGDSIDFSRGDVAMDVKANYLGGSTSEATINLTVQQPGLSMKCNEQEKDYQVSQLNDLKMPSDAIVLDCKQEVKSGGEQEFSDEEWNTIQDSDIQVDKAKIKGKDEKINFEVHKSDKKGEFLVLPKAYDGDVYKTATSKDGDLSPQLFVSYKYDEQVSNSTIPVKLKVENDLNIWLRFLDFLSKWWWLLLIVIIVLIIFVGEVRKPRFSGKISNRPDIIMIPQKRGLDKQIRKGKFQKSGFGSIAWVPFVAEKGTLRFAEGAS